MIEALESAADHATVAQFRLKRAAGVEELIPSEIVDRLLGGESRVWVCASNLG